MTILASTQQVFVTLSPISGSVYLLISVTDLPDVHNSSSFQWQSFNGFQPNDQNIVWDAERQSLCPGNEVTTGAEPTCWFRFGCYGVSLNSSFVLVAATPDQPIPLQVTMSLVMQVVSFVVLCLCVCVCVCVRASVCECSCVCVCEECAFVVLLGVVC